MTTSKTASTARRKASVEIISDHARERRPRSVTPPRKAKPVPALSFAPPLTDQIRVRAYYLSLERNGSAADPVGDWLRAERELTASGHRATARG